jgi:hypothetical protein
MISPLAPFQGRHNIISPFFDSDVGTQFLGDNSTPLGVWAIKDTLKMGLMTGG